MKKISVFVLIFVFCFVLFGCSPTEHRFNEEISFGSLYYENCHLVDLGYCIPVEKWVQSDYMAVEVYHPSYGYVYVSGEYYLISGECPFCGKD